MTYNKRSMKKIILTFPDNSTLEAENEVTPITLMNRFDSKGHKILAVKVNNEISSLYSSVNISAYIEPIYDNTVEGSEIYRRSLCFVLATAAHHLFLEQDFLLVIVLVTAIITQ